MNNYYLLCLTLCYNNNHIIGYYGIMQSDILAHEHRILNNIDIHHVPIMFRVRCRSLRKVYMINMLDHKISTLSRVNKGSHLHGH